MLGGAVWVSEHHGSRSVDMRCRHDEHRVSSVLSGVWLELGQSWKAFAEGWLCWDMVSLRWVNEYLPLPDIDACTNYPCSANADCADLPPPALDNQQGRTCTCQTGYAHYEEGTGCTGLPLMAPCRYASAAAVVSKEAGCRVLVGDGVAGTCVSESAVVGCSRCYVLCKEHPLWPV